jgi:D-alanine-D-alanine ligase
MNPAGNIIIGQYKFWVLFPYLDTGDSNLNYYYDFSQSLAEYTKVFTELNAQWKWMPVTMNNYKEVIRSIAASSGSRIPLVINLCDGDEINGTPGISVINELEKYDLIYTGADAYFYEVTTSKIPMKTAFDTAEVSTAPWERINGNKKSCKGICEKVGTPLLIKPAVSGGSMGVSVKNVVNNEEELIQRVEEMENGYHGWNLLADGLFVEKFITGPEFTSFIVGSSDKPEDCIIYEPVERVFHDSLPENEKFLSFDRLWEFYEDETPMPNEESFYEYRIAEPLLISALKQISLDAYCAVGGKGYGRLDIRMNNKTGKLYMLEVNAQCGLSEDEDYTSIGAILRVSGKTFTNLVLEVVEEAIARRFYQRKISL